MDIIDLEDHLLKLKLQLDFILRAFAAMAVDTTDTGLQPTTDEAFRGMELGQTIAQEIVEITIDSLKSGRQLPG